MMYPQQNNRNQRNPNQGDQFQNGPWNNIMGIGLNYIPTAPDIANLDAAQFLYGQIEESDAKHEAEREKRLPDKSKFSSAIKGLEAFEGQLNGLTSSYAQGYNSLNDGISKNPDFIFTDEGRTMVSELESLVNKAPEIAQLYKNKKQEYDAAGENGVNDRFLVDKGYSYVYDTKSGTAKKIKTSELDKYKSSSDYKIIRNNREAYDLMNQSADPTAFARSFNFGNGITVSKAEDELQAYYDKAGETMVENGDVTTLSNAEQLRKASEYAASNLSEEARDAFKADYIDQNGSYSEQGFERYLNNRISTISGIRKKYKVSLDEESASARKAAAKAAAEAGKPTGPIAIESPEAVNVSGDKFWWIGDETVKVASHAISSVPVNIDEPISSMSINQPVYHFFESGTADKSSNELGGGAMDFQGEAFVKPVRQRVMPVMNGTAYKVSNDGQGGRKFSAFSSDEDLTKKLVLLGDHNGIKIDDEVSFLAEVNGKEGRYVQGRDSDGNLLYVEVNLQGFTEYSTFEKDGDEFNRKGTIFKKHNEAQSTAAFSQDFSQKSDYNPFVKEVNGNTVLRKESIDKLEDLLLNLTGTNATITQLNMGKELNLLLKDRENPSTVSQLSKLLLDMQGEYTVEKLRALNPVAKTEYTPDHKERDINNKL